MTVYIDEIFAVNLIMDWLILYMAGNLAQYSTRLWRRTAAAILGAVYSIAVFLPDSDWLSILPVKVGWSVLMLMIAYPFVSWRQTGKLMVYFYLISFALSGASIAAMYLFSQPAMQTWNGVALVEVDFQLFWLAAGTALIFGAVTFLRGKLRQNLSRTQSIISGSIRLDEQEVSLQLLIDSGHSLTDPLTGKSVLIVSREKILSLFPLTVQNLLQDDYKSKAEVLLLLSEHKNIAGRWRIIPCQTVGQQEIMLGFRADRVILRHNGAENSWTDILVMLSPHKLSASENFQGIVPPDLI